MKKLTLILLLSTSILVGYAQETEYSIWTCCGGYKIKYVRWECKISINEQSDFDFSVNSDEGIDIVIDVPAKREFYMGGDGELRFIDLPKMPKPYAFNPYKAAVIDEERLRKSGKRVYYNPDAKDTLFNKPK